MVPSARSTGFAALEQSIAKPAVKSDELEQPIEMDEVLWGLRPVRLEAVGSELSRTYPGGCFAWRRESVGSRVLDGGPHWVDIAVPVAAGARPWPKLLIDGPW